MNPLLLLRTIGYLRWEQLMYRPLRIAQYRLYRSFPKLALRQDELSPNVMISPRTIETIRRVFTSSFAHFSTPLIKYDQQLSDLQNSRFTFLNRSLVLDPLDWNQRYDSHLWNYQLHYFDFAIWGAEALARRGDDRGWQCCRALIKSWVEQAHVGRSDGWDAYPLSLRVVNWIYAYALVAENESKDFLTPWRASIFRQASFLYRHLEHHLLANHLLKNAKALVIAGLFFENKDWLSEGEYLLWREFEEQVLPDGGHYERSPMYHAQALADFLEAYALLVAFDQMPPSENTEAKLRAMAGFLRSLSYPDGRLALFNDSANAQAAGTQALLEAATRVTGWTGEFSRLVFPHTGYYVWESPDESSPNWEKIIVDAGDPSVAYNAAHAHCDLLSYELWLDGQPFIVDSGVHGYGGDKFREYCRSTRAHNTVMFDAKEQLEVWGTFRMARRATMISAATSGDEQSWNFRGAFARYDGSVLHERRIHRSTDGNWTIADIARQGEITSATSFVHLHPNVEAKRTGSMAVLCRHHDHQVLIEPFTDGGATICTQITTGGEEPIQGWYFPEFGIAQPSATIQFHYQVGCGHAFGYRIKATSN